MTAQIKGLELHHGAATDVGRVREVNEDSHLAAPPVFVVADGMGGHQGGDVASRIVVEEFGRLVEEGYDPKEGVEAVAAALRSCQARIAEFAAAHQAPGARRFYAGTTAVVAVLAEDDDGPAWLLANLGDSRGYRFLDGRLEQVSVDHSLVQELLDAGRISPEEAAVHPERHVITRALGGTGSVEADYFWLPLSEVDRLLLCSDGVTGMIDDEAVADILDEEADPRDAAERLVAAAVDAGGRDNATAVVVDVVPTTTSSDDSGRGPVSPEHNQGAHP